VREETAHVPRLIEIAERTDVPVYQGAEFPLLNSKQETERWEALYGRIEYKAAGPSAFLPAARSSSNIPITRRK
jgi:inosine-uridine nucleoside N-ribohydrolase